MSKGFPNAGWMRRSLVTAGLSVRSETREYLDNHSGDDPFVAPTLKNLERINRLLSGIRSICKQTLLRPRTKDGTRPMTVVDLGCGGGDLLFWLARQCRRRRIDARIIGIDHDPRVAAIAQTRCRHEGSISVLIGSALDPGMLPAAVDWIVSNHFLHHLTRAEAEKLLTVSAARAKRGVIMNDLIRRRGSLLMFNLLCRLLKPAGHTAHDGLVSILRSFTPEELLHLAKTLNLSRRITLLRSGIGHRALVLTPYTDGHFRF